MKIPRFSLFFILFLMIPSLASGDEPPVTIGLMSELSGPYAPNGQACRAGYQVAIEHYNALKQSTHKLKFVYADSKGEAAAGVSEFKRLTEVEHALGIVVTRSQIGMALNPISKQKKIPLAGIVGHRDFVSANPYAFRVYPSVQREAAKLVEQLLQEKNLTAAVLTLEDEWTVSLSEEFEKRYTAAGGKILFSEKVLPGSADWSSLGVRIKQLNPQAIFVNLGAGTVGAALRKLHELDINSRKVSNFWAQHSGELETAGNAASEGLSFVEVNLNQAQFKAALKKFAADDNTMAIHYVCYAGATALIEAALNAPKLESPEDLFNSLNSLHALKLLDETVPVEERELIYQLQIKTIHQGKKAP